MQVTFRIQRYNPEKDAKPYFADYTLDGLDGTYRVLDALHDIKWQQDGTLTFRRSCAHGMCGSDGIRINGKNTLACSVLLKDINTKKPVVIEPLPYLPILKDLAPESYAILALTLTYGAYVSEVYRSGIESIHWSQVAASRSLGLTYFQTLRYVIVPQAARRIIPPLLNDFIALQKDTALVNVIGSVDSFNQAKIIASNHFNLSPVTTVAILFIAITIPQARFVDKMIERDQRRMRGGS